MAESMRREKRPVTYEDYLHFPADGNRYEVLEGELFKTPAPSTLHQKVLKNLAFELETFLRSHRYGELYLSPVDLVCAPHSVLQPDLLYLSREKAHLDRGHAVEGGAPDLVVEVLSPSSISLDRVFKFATYARCGVEWYWIVDPMARVIEEYTLETASYLLVARYEGEAAFSPRLFTSFEAPLSRIWA